MQRLGLDTEAYSEVLAVIGLFNQMNKLADALQIEPDVFPEPFALPRQEGSRPTPGQGNRLSGAARRA